MIKVEIPTDLNNRKKVWLDYVFEIEYNRPFIEFDTPKKLSILFCQMIFIFG